MDAGTLTIRRWRAGFGLDTPFPGLQLAMPHGITLLPDAIAVAELYGHRLLRFERRNGEVSTICGTTEKGDGGGQLQKPAALLFDGERLWIADMGNHRIVTCPLVSGGTKPR